MFINNSNHFSFVNRAEKLSNRATSYSVEFVDSTF